MNVDFASTGLLNNFPSFFSLNRKEIPKESLWDKKFKTGMIGKRLAFKKFV